VSYVFGTADYTDALGRGDIRLARDPRHLFATVVHWAPRARLSLGAAFRAGSPLPVPGLAAGAADDRPFATRLASGTVPAYSRLDLRVEQRFSLANRTGALYGEVLNALGHENMGVPPLQPWTMPLSAMSATERLYPRLGMVGVRFQF